MAGFLQDNGGNESSMRLMMLLVVALRMLVWAFLSVKTGTTQPFSMEDVGLIGVVMGAKAYQKNSELKADEKAPE
jgi:hypothetical protein